MIRFGSRGEVLGTNSQLRFMGLGNTPTRITPAHYEEDDINREEIRGQGVLIRDFGKYPPDMRNNLEKHGNEIITKLQVFRYPLKEVSFFARLASFNNLTYDELYHLGLFINGKYILDKSTVWNFEKKSIGVRKNLTIMNVDTFDYPMTINELLQKTEERIGKEAHYNYKALSTNCQYAVDSMLTTIKGNNNKLRTFVKQDMKEVAKTLPSFSQTVLDLGNKAGEIWNRLLKGEGGEDL